MQTRDLINFGKWDHWVWACGERYEIVWQRQRCFSGHYREWHLSVLTLEMPSSWHSLRLKFSLKNIQRSSTEPYCEWNPSCPCPASRVPRHGLSIHLPWPSLICFFHEYQNIFKKMPPQLQGRSEFWMLTFLLKRGALDLSLPKPKQVLELLLLLYECAALVPMLGKDLEPETWSEGGNSAQLGCALLSPS